MNEDIKNFLKSYMSSIDLYKDKVEPGSEKLQKVQSYLKEMEDLGKSCSDISEFMGKVAEADMMNKMSVYITELAEEGLANDRASGKLQIPTAAQYAAGYHAAYDSIDNKEEQPETVKIYERVFELEAESEFAPELMYKLAKEKLLVKMTTVQLQETSLKAALESEKLSQPVMVFHNREVASMAETAATPIEIEYESDRLVQLNRSELMCDQLFQQDFFMRLSVPIVTYLLNGKEIELRRVAKIYEVISDFFGVDYDDIFSNKRIVDLIEKVIIPPLNKEGQVYTLDSFITEYKNVVIKAISGKTIPKGPASRRNITLWGKEYPIENAFEAFSKPERPEEFSK